MKLYIFDKHRKERTFWVNFRTSNKPSEWPEEVLNRKYNAKLKKDPEINFGLYIEFKDEADASLFLLRWA